MAAIDSLLGILRIRKGDGLIVEADAVPALLIGGARSPLTMPPLARATVEDIVAELVPDFRAATARGEVVESTYESPGGEPFNVRVNPKEGRLVLKLTRSHRRPASAPAARPQVPSSAEGEPSALGGPISAPEATASAPAGPGPVLATPTVVAPAPAAPATLEPPELVFPTTLALVEEAVRKGASDLLLSARGRATMRQEGRLVELTLSARQRQNLIAELPPFVAAMIAKPALAVLERSGSVDVSYVFSRVGRGAVRFRVNVFRHLEGLALAMRRIWEEVPSPKSLNLPARVLRAMTHRDGLVVVAGSTGSGKSTTLVSFLEQLNQNRACHIVTLEDPIEYVFLEKQAVVHQRQVGTHLDAFATGLRAVLRESPDVIYVGELRDAETAMLALTAAETGHLVLTSMHAGGSVMAIERLVDLMPESQKPHIRQQLAAVLRSVLTQKLIPAPDGRLFPAVEILTINAAVAAQIREGRSHLFATQMELGAEDGMFSMDRALGELVEGGLVARKTAAEHTSYPGALDAVSGRNTVSTRPER